MLCLASDAHSQGLRGTVTDGETHKPLYPVNITNNANEQSTATDELGHFYLLAKKGDVMSFSYIGYHTIQRLATTDTDMKVELLPLSVSLQEYILHPEYTPYQKDSVEMATLYSTELNKKAIKPKVGADNGLVVDGLIGGAVQKMSKGYKQNKKFKENFKKDQEQKFIDTRYTQQLTSALTGITGDSLAIFMNTYPMEYKFARSASDLEIKMWIRENFKDYMKKHNNSSNPLTK